MTKRIFESKRLVSAVTVLLALSGFWAWQVMPRQEDPTVRPRWANIVTTFDGADAKTVERLVVDPIEEHLAEVEQIKRVTSTSRAGLALFSVELNDDVTQTTKAWDDVRDALALAQRDLPQGVSPPQVDDHLNQQESVVLALRSTSDMLGLRDSALQIKRELLRLRTVARITLIGDPGEQVAVAYDDVSAKRYGVSPQMLTASLARRTRIVPGGSLVLDDRRVSLRPLTDFASIEEIASTPIRLPSGNAVQLSELARVFREPTQPTAPLMRFNGTRVIGLGLVPKAEIHLVDFGKQVRAALASIRRQFPTVEIEAVTFQPDRVQRRLNDLGRSLLYGLGMLAALLIALMGLRMGIVVAAIVPLVALSSLAIYALGGGVLHQISIAALVIALGMLVDNAIVVAECVQRELDSGATSQQAVKTTIAELIRPLAAATGTTIAAFVPMLMAPGITAEFTRAIPIVIIIALVLSYVFAIAVTPLLCAAFLRPRVANQRTNDQKASAFVAQLKQSSQTALERIQAVGIHRYRTAVVVASVLLVGAVVLFGQVRRQFFPASDRNQLMVDLRLPDGADLGRTDRITGQVERMLMQRPDVKSVAAFIGRSAPRFYYNIMQWPRARHRAQLLITTQNTKSLPAVANAVRGYVARHIPDVFAVATPLEQGPMVNAPIEIRAIGNDLRALQQTSEQVAKALRDTAGATDVQINMGIGSPNLRFTINDSAAIRRGVNRDDVALALLGRTHGVVAGQYRVGDDPVPIVVRSSAGEDLPLPTLPNVQIAANAGTSQLAQVTHAQLRWQPSAIYHRDRKRVVAVTAQLANHATYDQVIKRLAPKLAAQQLPAGITMQIGGAKEGSGEANEAMIGALPIGLLSLITILLLEFNSFRRILIVLTTVPLSLIGVVPGLLLADQPLGFMSLLGLIALAGVVVNNAIVLLDVVEHQRASGASIADALAAAVRQRTRPILLTTITTVFGLLPLALSPSTLWPPLAWTMISGLVASTALSLLVVPALYRLCFREVSQPKEVRCPGLQCGATV